MKRDVTLTGALMLIVGAIIILIGGVGPNMGSKALVFFAIEIVGILSTGIGGAILIILFGCQAIVRFKKEKPDFIKLLVEFLQFLLSCFVYCGGSFWILVTILSFDMQVPVLGRVVFILLGVLAVVIMVLFRKYRKKHPPHFEHISGFVIMLIPIALIVLFLFGGILEGTKLIKDVSEGLPICTETLTDVKATRNISRKSITTYHLCGLDENGEEQKFQIDSQTYREWKEHSEWEEQTATIYYYKNTRVVYGIEEELD